MFWIVESIMAAFKIYVMWKGVENFVPIVEENLQNVVRKASLTLLRDIKPNSHPVLRLK